jgi:hypothetical protein
MIDRVSEQGLDLIALAERCEAATGPDRELDIAMLPLIGLSLERVGGFYDSNNHAVPLPRFSASLDAAMTLAPVWAQVSVLLDAINDCQADEDQWLRDLPRFVCAAALRARAPQQNSDKQEKG